MCLQDAGSLGKETVWGLQCMLCVIQTLKAMRGFLPHHNLLLSPSCRLPSGWLSLDKSVFQLVAQTVGASMWREAAPEPEPPRAEPPEVSPLPRPARGLCPNPPW